MSTDQIQAHMQEQVSRARDALGEALGRLQDIRQPGLDVDLVSASLAKSVQVLFDAESSWTLDSALVEQAMGHLRRTLALMQDVRGSDPALQESTATIARTLAILFPVTRALLEPEVADVEPEGPIPLTRKLPLRPSHAPLPLVSRRSAQPDPAAATPPEEERRDAPRRSVEVEIGFQSETNFFTGLSADISAGGLFVASYDIPPLGTPINVNFSLPGGPMMSLDGVVRWVREFNPMIPEMVPGFGVSFDDLTPLQETAINEYMARSSPILYEDVSE